MMGLDLAEKMTGLDKLKLLTGVLLVVAILTAAFGAGWAVNGWRLDSAHAEQVRDLTAQVTTCQGKVVEQNHGTDLLHEKKMAADDRRNLARDMSKSILTSIEAKAVAAAASTATDCEGVLKEAHGDAR